MQPSIQEYTMGANVTTACKHHWECEEGPKAPQPDRTISGRDFLSADSYRRRSTMGTTLRNSARRRTSTRSTFKGGAAWAMATSRIHTMNSKLIQLKCSNGDLTTTPETIIKAPRFADKQACAGSDVRIIALIVDALRRDGRLIVPEDFDDWSILASEAKRLGLPKIADESSPHTITLSCQAALSTGRLNPEVTFRKVIRIVVAGRVALLRDVFEDQLNEARDSDAAEERYTSRFYLKHAQLERSFDSLALKGFRLVGSNTFAPSHVPQHNIDEACFVHHSQFTFVRMPGQTPVYNNLRA